MNDESDEIEWARIDYGFRKPCSCGALSAEIHRCDSCGQDLADSGRIVRVAGGTS